MDRQNSGKLPWVRIRIFVVLAALAANAVVSYRELRRLVQNNHWVVHTLQVIRELDATLASLKGAEDEQRGYLITADAAYLDQYSRATMDVTDHLAQVETLTGDNPQQQRRIATLQRYIQERLGLSQRTIDLEQEGKHGKARQIIAGNLGREKMDQIQALIAEMRADEDGLLANRTEASRLGIRRASLTFIGVLLVAIVFVMAFFRRVEREMQERSRAAIAARDREAWLRTTLHSIGDAVIATDATGTVTFVNRVAERLIACATGECQGKPLDQVLRIFNEVTGEATVNPVSSVIERGTITDLASQSILRNRRGEEIPIEDSAAPIFNEDGRITGVVFVFRDVGQQRKAQQIARTSEKLAVTGRMAAAIAHEINNPLEAAMNLLYLAQNSKSAEEIQRHIVSADHELSRMAHITRKTLAFHRTASAPTPANIRTLLEEVIDVYRGRAANEQITVELKCPQDLEITTVKGDLVQIVSNLIANALDALEPHGHLRIQAASENGGAMLEIADDGSGIPTANLGKVFEPFFTTKNNTGTGLGLWVVKDLIDKLGGMIFVTSSVEGSQRGTRFSFFLPSLRKDISGNTKAS